MLVFPSEALISDLIVAERAYAADRWGQPLTYDFGRRVAWLSFPRWKQHDLVGTRSRAIRRRMSKKGCKLKTGEADGKSLSSESKSASQKQQKEASRRAVPDARERILERIPPGAGGAARSYHFYGAYQRFNFKHRASTRR